ncbi:MAG TPA: radical SAM protein [candidate division Zixibacteria bacterium]|nr:radical SAM protein [candidate division Zixibacteria bacterium]
MKEKIRSLTGGSYLKGKLPTGCKICRNGAQLFFLMTGKCCENCYYCSLTKDKRGKDVILANERPITSFSGVMLEVTNMNALGAAITGGDPLVNLDQTINYISQMKKEFGKKFHIHLYTSGRFATEENLTKLYDAGLDEIRFHPQNKEQKENIEIALNFDWVVGAEIPIIPGEKKEILKFLDYLENLEFVKFCNFNELEATEANIEDLKKKSFKLKNTDSSAIDGSEGLALEILEEADTKFSLHYCSSLSKDAVQFRNRLKRTANVVKKPYEEIQDGMLVKAVISLPKYIIPEELYEALIDEFEIETELVLLRDDKKIETSWYIADVLKDALYERYDITDIDILYEYPTFGRIVIAKAPLRELSLAKDLLELKEDEMID